MSLIAQQSAAGGSFDRGAVIQLQGCVVDGERKGSYVFSRVTAWPVAASPNGPYGPRHFWLANSAKHDLEGYVGRTIQVTGRITDIRESEVERNPGYNSRDGHRVAIELPDGDVITSVELAGVGTDERAARVDMKITLLKVEVDSLLVVMATCLQSFK